MAVVLFPNAASMDRVGVDRSVDGGKMAVVFRHAALIELVWTGRVSVD